MGDIILLVFTLGASSEFGRGFGGSLANGFALLGERGLAYLDLLIGYDSKTGKFIGRCNPNAYMERLAGATNKTVEQIALEGFMYCGKYYIFNGCPGNTIFMGFEADSTKPVCIEIKTSRPSFTSYPKDIPPPPHEKPIPTVPKCKPGEKLFWKNGKPFCSKPSEVLWKNEYPSIPEDTPPPPKEEPPPLTNKQALETCILTFIGMGYSPAEAQYLCMKKFGLIKPPEKKERPRRKPPTRRRFPDPIPEEPIVVDLPEKERVFPDPIDIPRAEKERIFRKRRKTGETVKERIKEAYDPPIYGGGAYHTGPDKEEVVRCPPGYSVYEMSDGSVHCVPPTDADKSCIEKAIAFGYTGKEALRLCRGQ